MGDRELEQLASEPAHPLFPPLRTAAEAMFPLAVVLAFLPALYAVANRGLTEEGALQGLEALRFMSLTRDAGATFPLGIEQLENLHFQPPLMSWLTAFCMNLFGVGTDAGLVASSLLCTVGLLLAAYALGRRLGGEYLGLVSVVLLSFHPLILQGAQQPVPQSAAVLFALVSLAGIIAHWQKSSTIISYQGLLGGISLGACLLAGGPVALAIAVILLLYVALWKLEAHMRHGQGIVWDRSQFSRRTAFRSTAVVVATAFALGGWHILLLRARYGADFWSRWFMPAARDSAAKAAAPTSVSANWTELAWLASPFLGLTLVGLGSVIRDVARGDEDPARRHRMILFPWIGVALSACYLADGPGQSGDSTVMLWQSLLAVPLVIAAALGFIEIAERRAAFEVALAAGLFGLAIGVMAGGPWSMSESALSAAGLISRMLANPWFVALLAIALGVALVRVARRDETRRRWVLAGMLGTIVAANCWWGTRLPRDSGASQRELQELRTGLARLPPVSRVTFVAPTRPGQTSAAEPPARLIYGLVTQWPRASFNFVSSWEAAASSNDAASERGSTARTLLVTWSRRGMARGLVPNATLKLAAPPFLFEDLEVAVYVR
jgi:4-amino-4-deoxy-L-arabinose transferase-like glycosyltransferase